MSINLDKPIPEDVRKRLHDNQQAYWVDPLAAAERAVIRAAIHWVDGTSTYDLAPAVQELLRLRAARTDGTG